MANTQPLIDLVSHIVRFYTVEHGVIEVAAYDEVEAVFLARIAFDSCRQIYKVTVHQFKPEKVILRLS